MASLFVEKSVWAFLFITVFLGGGGAYLAGRGTARSWKPFWRVAVSMLLLGAAIRFLHWGVFMDATLENWREAQGDLWSKHYYVTDTLILIAAAGLGWRVERVRQMTRQYPWLYQRAGALSWTERHQ